MDSVRVFFLLLVLAVVLLPGCVQQQEQPPVTTVAAFESIIQTTTTIDVSTIIPAETTTTTAQKPLVTQTTTTSRQCTIPTMQQCIDSDGSDPYTKGTVSGRLNLYLTDVSDPGHYNWSEKNESCVNATAVLEYTCEVIDCNLLLKNKTIDCPLDYSCRDGACLPKNETDAAATKTPRYGEVKASITLNKPLYRSGEDMEITVKINSQKRLDVNVNIYGIFAGYFRLNQTQAVVLNPGANLVSFSYPSPPCNQCAGVAEGTYVISAVVLYNDDVVARDNKNVELKQ
jgi:hypothetical protein